MKIKVSFVIMLMLMAVGNVQAQNMEKNLSREEKKVLQEKLDSLLSIEAERAVKEKAFTLEADRVLFKYGHTAYVNSNTNFVSVQGDKAAVQIAFNVPLSGLNGLGGVTVDGTVSDYETKKDKEGNLLVTMNVMGIGISARVDIRMTRGTSQATIDVTPNFNSNRFSLQGVILPSQKSSVFKGHSF